MNYMVGASCSVRSINSNEKNNFYTQYSLGESIANYYVGFSNRQLDAVYDPEADNMTRKFIQGGFPDLYTHLFSGVAIFSHIWCFVSGSQRI